VDRARARRWIVLVLLAAGGARLALALLGGQWHYGDEIRYYRGAAVAFSLLDGNTAALREVSVSAAHTGFVAVTLALVAPHVALALAFGPSADHPLAAVWLTPHLGAALLGLFSTLNLWLLYRVVRRTGADRPEALWALLLAACANCLLFPARHLVPYDASLSFLLAALLLGLGRGTLPRAALSGAAAAFGLTVYNGHWALLPVLAAALAWRWRADPVRFRAAAAWVAGAAAGLAFGFLPLVALGQGDVWTGLGTFSATITDGDFAEGWSLPWAFFWHAEGWLGVAALLLAGAGAVLPGVSPRARRWLLAAAAVYGLLVLASVGLEKFVVYARTARPLALLVVPAAAAGLAALLARRPVWRAPAAVALLLAAAFNAAPLFPQRYPVGLEREVHRTIGVPTPYLTFLGSWDKRDNPPVTRPDLLLVNTYALFGFLSHRPYPPGEVLLDHAHPLALPFYQYDGHTPAERALLRAHEPRMRLIRPAPGVKTP
jgi:hypothetical protein